MSTKIYNGFRFKRNYNLIAIHRIIRSFRKKIQPIVQKKVCSFIAWNATRYIDEHALEITRALTAAPYLIAIEDFEERRRKIKQTCERDPDVDMEFTLCILPTRKQIFGIVYTEQRDLLKMWLAQKEIVSYPYWDNTDPIEGLSWEEWRARGEEWDSALKEFHGIPALNGFVAECEPPQDFYDVTKILPFLPYLNERIEYWTKEVALARRMKVREEEFKNDVDRVGTIYMDCRAWLRTEEGLIFSENVRAEVASKLIPVITKDVLLHKFEEMER